LYHQKPTSLPPGFKQQQQMAQDFKVGRTRKEIKETIINFYDTDFCLLNDVDFINLALYLFKLSNNGKSKGN
jgi:hypothetical protein